MPAGWQILLCADYVEKGSAGSGRNMCLETVENFAQAGRLAHRGSMNLENRVVKGKKELGICMLMEMGFFF